MNLSETLESLIRAGVTLTENGVPSSTRPLASAAWQNGKLWFCDLWPANEFAQHILQGSLRAEGPMLLLEGQNGLVAVIAPMESDERTEARWDKWLKASDLQQFAASLRQSFLNSNP